MPDGVSHALERLNVIRQVSDLETDPTKKLLEVIDFSATLLGVHPAHDHATNARVGTVIGEGLIGTRSEEHTSELQSRENLVCRLLLEKKKKTLNYFNYATVRLREL